MSSKKDKLIEEAQRFALRGQMDKAIKTYRQVVALDPSAISQRQRLAELLLKSGSLEDARVEFESIGKYYAGNGFYLKAIAVYKKLQMLLPGEISITLTLADLNEKHGLVANALAEYKQVYDHYKQASNYIEALRILERMHNVDRQNTGIMLMLGESYFQAARKEEAYQTFSDLAALLYERGDNASCIRLNDRIRQLFPEKPDFMYEVLARQVESGNAAGAVGTIQSMLQQNPNDRRFWELIVQTFRCLDEPQRVKVAYQHYLRFFPAELSAQKGLMECTVAEGDVAGTLQLIEQYGQGFVDGGAASDLVSIYRSLESIDPVNTGILAGLEQACRAANDLASAEAVASKIASLTSITSKKQPPPKPQDDEIEIVESAPADFAFDDQQSEVAAARDEDFYVDISDIGDTEFSFAQPLDEAEKTVDLDELEIEIEIDDEPVSAAGSHEEPVTAEDDWFESVEEMFEGIASTPRSVKFGSDVDISDAQSHYDLGVAFKEMGLYDEAISELRQAAEDPSRKVTCFVLQAGCLREKGDVATAENLLRSLLKPGLNQDDYCSVKYDLALTCEAAGRKDEANALLAEIDAEKPDFRDVHSRLDMAREEPSITFSAEDLDGFDLK